MIGPPFPLFLWVFPFPRSVVANRYPCSSIAGIINSECFVQEVDKSGFLGLRHAVYEWRALLSWLVAERLYGMRSSLEWRLSVFSKESNQIDSDFLVCVHALLFLSAGVRFFQDVFLVRFHTHTVGSLSCCVIWAESACHVFLVLIVTSNSEDLFKRLLGGVLIFDAYMVVHSLFVMLSYDDGSTL